MLSVNAAPSAKSGTISRSRRMATLTCGGSNEHCCTQLASIPVSTRSRVTVSTKMPLGIRPSADASGNNGSSGFISASSFGKQLDDQLLDLGVTDLPVTLRLERGPLAAAVEDEHAGQRADVELGRPEIRQHRLIQAEVSKGGFHFHEEF